MTGDDFGLDPIDDALRRRLGDAQPHPAGDPDAVLATLTPRFQRARRRHRVILATGSALAVVAIIAVGTVVATTAGSDGSRVQIPPANSGRTDPPVTTTTTTLPVVPDPTTTLPPPAGTAAGGNVTPVPTNDGGPPTTVPAPVTKTYRSDGGSVTVKADNGVLSIVSTAPASGFAEERHDTGPTRIEVRFEKSGTEWRIKVELSNGQPVEEITEHGS